MVFLEEDHYVAEDFIHVLKLMESTCKTSCPQCNILSLGTYLKTFSYYGDPKKVFIEVLILFISGDIQAVYFITVNNRMDNLCMYVHTN